MKRLLLILTIFLAWGSLLACSTTTQTTEQTVTSTLPSSSTTTSQSTTTTTTTTTTQTTTSQTTTQTTTEQPYQYNPIEVPSSVLEEARLSFKFFWEVVNGDPSSPGYGLIADRFNVNTNQWGDSSIASVGYGLAAIPIGIENGWIGYQEGYQRALGTVQTLQAMPKVNGFFYHFVSMETGERSGTSEVSIIDTAIMIAGAIVAGEYFGGQVQEIVNQIYQAIQWDWYFDTNRNMFYMGYNPDTGRFGGHWDHVAEQLMVYVLAAGSDQYAVGPIAYNTAKNATPRGSYGSSGSFYISWAGSLFTYQFAHAWVDFRNIVDQAGYDWFDNSIRATQAAIDYGQTLAAVYKTFGINAWGASASDGPDGYNGSYGNLPSMGGIFVDGTLAPYGAAASMPFQPARAIAAIEHYTSIPQLQSKYGFRDSYHLGLQPTAPLQTPRPRRVIPVDGWFNSDVIGIDKGITLMMIENYRSGIIWHFFMQNESIQTGLQVLGFRDK